jgi:TetR/AcrR family fatty acid metabolism transcriptional regulator
MGSSTTGGVARSFTETARRAQIIQAAIDTIAGVGFARASLAAIGSRIGISKGLVGYHFRGKDELIREVVVEILARGRAFMMPRIDHAWHQPAVLRTYIEANLDFMLAHRNEVVAMVEIIFNGAGPGGTRPFYRDADADGVLRELEQLLAEHQASGALRGDFDPAVMATAIRGAIDAVPYRLAREPSLDVRHHGEQLADIFDRATRPLPPDAGVERRDRD